MRSGRISSNARQVGLRMKRQLQLGWTACRLPESGNICRGMTRPTEQGKKMGHGARDSIGIREKCLGRKQEPKRKSSGWQKHASDLGYTGLLGLAGKKSSLKKKP